MAYPVAPSDPTAVFGRRVVAVLIDAVLVLVPVIVLFTAQFEYLEVADTQQRDGAEFCDDYLDQVGGLCVDFEDVDDRVYFSDGDDPAPNLLYLGLSIALLVVLQGLTGWTPGKLLMGLRTVREDGAPAGILKALVRWLLWIVDGFPYFIPGLVGFIVALTTTGHRRVGDIATRTFVVRRQAAGSPIAVPGLTPPAGGAPGPLGTPAPGTPGAPWGPPADPNAAGWASPAPPPASAPEPPVAPAAPVPTTEGPQWDEARGTYIQWDPTQGAWMQWDEGSKAWTRMPGQ